MHVPLVHEGSTIGDSISRCVARLATQFHNALLLTVHVQYRISSKKTSRIGGRDVPAVYPSNCAVDVIHHDRGRGTDGQRHERCN